MTRIYELTQAVVSGSVAESYSYDAVGNRLTSAGPTSYNYNASNELTSTSAATYGYDNNGNTTSKTDSTGTTNYTWDFENRLASVTLPGTGGTVYFRYDPLGRRIYKSSSAGTTVYVYDGDSVVQELNGAGSLEAQFTQGAWIDEPLAMYSGLTTSFFHSDGLRSIDSLTDPSGAVAASYVYNSFGNLSTSSGTIANPFQFTAREFDPETSLYFYRARYYDPAIGRFLSEDPLRFKAGVNFFAYTTNNPVNKIDPKGLKCLDCPSGGWSGFGGTLGGFLISGGAFGGIYRVRCWGNNVSCWIRVSCGGLGLGLGVALGAESIWISDAYSSSGLAGQNESLLISGGAGAAGVGGALSGTSNNPYLGPFKNPSTSSGATFGAGVGLGGGYVVGTCNTTVLSCKEY